MVIANLFPGAVNNGPLILNKLDAKNSPVLGFGVTTLNIGSIDNIKSRDQKFVLHTRLAVFSLDRFQTHFGNLCRGQVRPFFTPLTNLGRLFRASFAFRRFRDSLERSDIASGIAVIHGIEEVAHRLLRA